MSTYNEQTAKIVRFPAGEEEDPRVAKIGRFRGSIISHERASRTSVRARRWTAPGILAAGELTTVFGAPGAGKSVLGEDVSCRLAAGIDWNDQPLPNRYYVLYLAAERPAQVKRRMSAFCARHGIPPLENLSIYDGGDFDLCQPGELIAMIEASAEMFDGPPDVIVIDTLSAAMSKPVSDTTATNAVAHNLVEAARESGAAIMVIHHSALAAPDRLAGGHLDAAMDIVVRVTKRGGIHRAEVVKDNGTDPDKWAKLFFRTAPIDVECAGGETSSEAVAVPIEDPLLLGMTSTQKTGDAAPKMTRDMRDAIDALSSCDGNSATDDIWRSQFKEKAGRDRKAPALRMAFNRAKSALLEGEHVREQSGMFALKQSEQSEQNQTNVS